MAEWTNRRISKADYERLLIKAAGKGVPKTLIDQWFAKAKEAYPQGGCGYVEFVEIRIDDYQP